MTDHKSTVADLEQAMKRATWEKGAIEADMIAQYLLVPQIIETAASTKMMPSDLTHLAGNLFARLLLHCTIPGRTVEAIDHIMPFIRAFAADMDKDRIVDGPPSPEKGG